MGKEELQDLELLGKLRECLDPLCAEYHDSSIEQKVEILRKIKSKGMSMHQILKEYKDRYKEHPSNPIAELPRGLGSIVDYFVHDKGMSSMEQIMREYAEYTEHRKDSMNPLDERSYCFGAIIDNLLQK